ncbi:MAG: L,D-transpeptidase family protein [Alphaproteobacteria bacterium]|nr:L,D-transpeptidase family protein [Alphaproteobacteria bacterium]
MLSLLSGCAAQAGPPEGPRCPATVAELPASERHSADDPRLQGDGLMVVLKEARVVGLYRGGALATLDEAPACWSVALGVNGEGSYPPGHKIRQGDRRTPEGFYRTSDKPWSSFYGAIAVHYPNAADAEVGLSAGLISEGQRDAIVAALAKDAKPPQNTRLGGEILLHGGGSSSDWTWGCVALDDPDIDALRAALPQGMRTDVLILP